ncbi:putative porin [Shewanella khirikhana]|uniref:putative porin n=1 Tax=Shewanella khirikhana TaxID=1965282 RepID=UPI0030CE8FA3
MKKVSGALSLGLALLCTQVQAQDTPFQHEVSVSYGANSEYSDSGVAAVGYNYYLSPVDQSKDPYVLAGYLAQSSVFSALYATGVNDSDYDTYNVGGEYVFASKWFIGAALGKSSMGNAADSDTYSITAGWYFNDVSRAYLSYARANAEYFGFDSDLDTWTAGVSSYLRLQSTEGIKFDASIQHNSVDGNQFGSSSMTSGQIGASWFINRAWHVGANYAISEDDDTFALNTGYYLRMTDSLSANFVLAKQFDSGDSNSDDGFNFNVGLNGRF